VARDCKVLPFLRKTKVEEREERLRKAATRAEEKAKWEARQAKQVADQAEWEASEAGQRTLAWRQNHARIQATKEQEWETSSLATTCTLTPVDEEEVQCKVEADKEVRRLEKKFREMVKLECCNSLEPLQKAKLERKPDIERELAYARRIAAIQARDELRELSLLGAPLRSEPEAK